MSEEEIEVSVQDDELDDEQRDAVESSEAAIAVLAGPGSGKTRVLSYRTRHLLHQDRETKALLLTFTNKAAAEMKARALDVAVVTSDRIWASTFHTFSMRVLRNHGDLVGVDREFEIPDEEEQKELKEEAGRRAGASDRSFRWSYLRVRRQQPRPGETEVIRWAEAYEELKRELRVLDFDDLIVNTADLFEQTPAVAKAYGAQFPEILVDEFQDTNPAQFAIVQALWEHGRTISVFADDDQAIYQFAGAEAKNVQRFVDELDAREYPLTMNYRCRHAIVDVANRLIACDTEASGRTMRAHYGGGEVRSLGFQSMEDEARALADEMEALVGDGVRPSDIGVLARTRWRIRDLLRELEARQLPTSNWLGPAYDPEERRAFGTCLSVVRGRLSDRQAKRLFQMLDVEETEERDPLAVLQLHEHLRVCSHLIELRALVWDGGDLRAVVEKTHEAVVVARPDLTLEAASLVEAVEAFATHDPGFSLDHLIAELALGGVGGPPTAGGGIKVATLQATKGLQWPHVYMVGLEEGKLPSYLADTDEDIREERRICFVGVCRAETHLTLSRIAWYRTHRQHPSRFLSEMNLA
ncbi:MAG TPA: ATP-dependent helicase [Microbacteriaceae bacterium]|jgi:DNA helicase-2/ATP-dependent DNA helicase PcrA|nr:ATP-dependent helicase [Microbacteriaceae bacterium]